MKTDKKKAKTENRPKIPDTELLALLEKLKIKFTIHALERLEERKILSRSILWMLKGKTTKRFRYPRSDQYEEGMWKYRIHGTDIDGNLLGTVVVIENEVILITAFYIGDESND